MREQVAGRVPADVAGVGGQVEELVAAAEDDLDLLDLAAVALEAVVDPRADDAAAELGDREAEGRPGPDPARSAAGAPWSRPGRSWIEAKRRIAPGPRSISVVPPKSACGTGSPAAQPIGRPGRHELLDERRLGALAEPDQRPRQERPLRGAGRPAQRRSGAPGGRRRARGGGSPGSRSRARARPASRRPAGAVAVERLADPGRRRAPARRRGSRGPRPRSARPGARARRSDGVLAELDDPVRAVGDLAGRRRARPRCRT